MGVFPPNNDIPDANFAHPNYVYINVIIILYIFVVLYILKTFRIFNRFRFTVSKYEEIPLVGSSS